MKTTAITLVASLASTVAANPVAIPIDFSPVEARQNRPPPSYGGACQRIAQQYPALISYPNSTIYETENHCKLLLNILPLPYNAYVLEQCRC